MSKVSVIVPVYNAQKTLHKCIKSILSQTYSDFELVLVNDGSTDISLTICSEFKLVDSRIIVINKENEGCIKARKAGIQASESEYVMFVDADDWIHELTLETLYFETTTHNLDIAVCNMFKVIGNGRLVKQMYPNQYFKLERLFEKEKIMNELVPAYFHGHPFPSNLVAKLYKKDLLFNSGTYLDRISFLGEDLYYNLEIFLKAKRVKLIDKPFYYYRAGGQTSKYMSYLFDDMVNGYEIQKEVIDQYYGNQNNHLNGISIMLLNTFKTCLYNLLNGKFSKQGALELINQYCENSSVRECIRNEGAKKYFPKNYLNAIDQKNVDFLYLLGKEIYLKRLPKNIINSVMSKVI